MRSRVGDPLPQPRRIESRQGKDSDSERGTGMDRSHVTRDVPRIHPYARSVSGSGSSGSSSSSGPLSRSRSRSPYFATLRPRRLWPDAHSSQLPEESEEEVEEVGDPLPFSRKPQETEKARHAQDQRLVQVPLPVSVNSPATEEKPYTLWEGCHEAVDHLVGHWIYFDPRYLPKLKANTSFYISFSGGDTSYRVCGGLVEQDGLFDPAKTSVLRGAERTITQMLRVGDFKWLILSFTVYLFSFPPSSPTQANNGQPAIREWTLWTATSERVAPTYQVPPGHGGQGKGEEQKIKIKRTSRESRRVATYMHSNQPLLRESCSIPKSDSLVTKAREDSEFMRSNLWRFKFQIRPRAPELHLPSHLMDLHIVDTTTNCSWRELGPLPEPKWRQGTPLSTPHFASAKAVAGDKGGRRYYFSPVTFEDPTSC